MSTPIGNLEDITLRAIRTLKECETIAAEDTRYSRKLLSHLGIEGKVVTTLNAHSRDKDIKGLTDTLLAGKSVALVPDAGTPSVSDPGGALVRRAIELDIAVTVIPGPSAVTGAIAISGLGESGFLFLGFLPRKGDKRRQAIGRILVSSEPGGGFESPKRARQCIEDLAAILPDRDAVIVRELTKLHEQVLRGSLAGLAAAEWEGRGEFTIVIGGAIESDVVDPALLDTSISRLLAAGLSSKDAASELARAGLGKKRDIYSRILELRLRESEEKPEISSDSS